MKYAVITSMRSTYPLKLCCRLLGVSAGGYYKWRVQKPRKASYERDKLAVLAAHQKTRCCYGAVRLHQALQAEGFALSLWRVKKIRHELGLVACKSRRRVKTTDSNHTFPVAPNILQRNFSSKQPDSMWVSDITYIPTAEGWLYLAGIKDCCSKEIVGFHMSSHMDTTLVLKALTKAYEARRPSHGLLLHSDRGSQYCSKAYQQQLSAYRMQCSMSRKGNCHDNAPMESFWGVLKNELVYRTRFRSRRQAKAAVTEYIEIFYNRQRIQAGLGYLSPAAFAKNFRRGKAALAA